jgi:hypothetical protein
MRFSSSCGAFPDPVPRLSCDDRPPAVRNPQPIDRQGTCFCRLQTAACSRLIDMLGLTRYRLQHQLYDIDLGIPNDY